VSFDDLLSDLARTLARVPDSTADEARETYLRACRRLDENPAEQQRIDDIADLLDAEETLHAQARAAADRGDSATSIPLLRKCAEAGTGEAAWLLAQLLEETGSTAEAMIWYQHASDDGDDRADAKLAAIRARPCPHVSLASSPGEDSADQSAPRFLVSLASPSTWRGRASWLAEIHAEAAAGSADPAVGIDGLCRELLSLIVLGAPDRSHTSGEGLLPASILPLLFFSGPAPDQRAPLADVCRAADEVCNYLTHDTSWFRTRLMLKLARSFQAQEAALGTDWAMPDLVIWTPPGADKSRAPAALARWLLECKYYGQPCPTDLRRYPAGAGWRDTRRPAREPIVAEVMLPPSEVPACRPDTTVAQALELLVQSGTQALPVCETTWVTGIVTLADLARYISDHQGVPPMTETVKALIRPAAIVPPGTPLSAIAKTIADDGLIVVSGSGEQPDGYLTTESLLTQAPPGVSIRPAGPDRPPLLIPGTGAVLLDRRPLAGPAKVHAAARLRP
jgi:CBS domain-containing protein